MSQNELASDLERRIRVLEDIEEIKRLKTRYCALCDDSYDADALAELFAEDAVWDGGIRGINRGREEIRSFFKAAPRRLPFAIHMVTNASIEVEGDTAKGTWYLFQPCTFASQNGGEDRAVWGAARYDEEYVRLGGQWRFQNLKLTSHFWTPFDQGWAETQFA